MKEKSALSIIITTYNWPQALKAVLMGLSQQTSHDFEILIADDGSKPETRALIQSMQSYLPVPLRHVWQEDQGFRAARIRNLAVLSAQYNYIVFLDGDSIPRPHFVEYHLKLAELGYFVAGNRILLEKNFTQQVLESHEPIHNWSLKQWGLARIKRQCNRFLPLLSLPLGTLRLRKPKKWQGVKTCNLGVWKEDLYRVNGFDEQFTGWGYEDSDLVIRLIASGIRRKEGRFAIPVLHLWHPTNDRSHEAENWAKLQEAQSSGRKTCDTGLLQHLVITP